MTARGAEHAFARALRSYQTGGITLHDFLGQIDALLASGASVSELLELLWQREQVERLPAAAHSVVLARIEAPLRAAAEGRDQPSTQASSMPLPNAEADTVVLGDERPERLAPMPEPSEVDFFAGRFRLVELIADGAMSRVYYAEDVTVPSAERQPLALKIFKRPMDASAESMAAVEAEFARLRALSHPNIVRLFECGRADSTLFISMEYLAGQSLYEHMHSAPNHAAHPLQAAEVRKIVEGVAQALQYAHEHSAVHGDLKPGNVFLTARGVKVIDFGTSFWSGNLALTPRYASPQLLAHQAPTPADDVYSLACVTYEALSGQHPFVGADGVETAREPPRRREFTPSEYAALLRGLASERAQRTPTAHEFMQQFSNVESVPAGKAWWMAVPAIVVLALGGWWIARSTHPIKPAAKVRPVAEPATHTVPPSVPPPVPLEARKALRDCATCPVMMVVPPGQFRQGVSQEDRNASAAERPDHVVVLAHSLAVAVDDVTVAEFAAFAAATHREVRGCDVYDGAWRRRNTASFEDPGYAQSDTHPVTCVSWRDAVAYTQWLSGESGHAYRLPSAAEWEYAARGGGTAPMPWDAGGANACANANVADDSAARRYPGWTVFACSDGFVYTAPVGSFPANGYGLHDMLGNALQWTQDCWHADYAGAPEDGSARLDGDCRDHELRGGSWFSAPSIVRTSHRNHFAADYRTSSVGFRVVRDVEP